MSKSEDEKNPHDESSDTRERLVENDEQKTDEMNGSTVEIVQPADLKPKHLGFTRTLFLAMFAAMIGTGAQYGYALGVMNAPSEVRRCSTFLLLFFERTKNSDYQKLHRTNLSTTIQHDSHRLSTRYSLCYGNFGHRTRWRFRWTFGCAVERSIRTVRRTKKINTMKIDVFVLEKPVFS